MFAQDRPQSPDSDIAAALEAIAPLSATESAPSGDITAACEELAADGTRPTVRAVYAYMMAEHGTAPSFRDLTPVVRTWRAGRWKSSAVRRAYRAYQRLDAEQKEAFRQLVETEIGDEPDSGELTYEITVELFDGRILTERARRKTQAWVKYYNLRDCHRHESVRVTVVERSAHGTTKTVKQWTKRGL